MARADPEPLTPRSAEIVMEEGRRQDITCGRARAALALMRRCLWPLLIVALLSTLSVLWLLSGIRIDKLILERAPLRKDRYGAVVTREQYLEITSFEGKIHVFARLHDYRENGSVRDPDEGNAAGFRHLYGKSIWLKPAGFFGAPQSDACGVSWQVTKGAHPTLASAGIYVEIPYIVPMTLVLVAAALHLCFSHVRRSRRRNARVSGFWMGGGTGGQI